jgi:hypothetical protein
MKSSYLSVGVSLLAITFCLLVTAGIAQADVYLVDRGLPAFGAYATTSGGGVDWANRTNIANGNFDSKDPIYAGGMAQDPGDDFTMPTGPMGPNSYHISNIRVWLSGTSAYTFSQEFNSVGLMVGTGTSTTSNPQGTLGELGGAPGPGPFLPMSTAPRR